MSKWPSTIDSSGSRQMLLDWPWWKRLLMFPLVLGLASLILISEGLQMRYVFKGMQAFWIGSPVIFCLMKLMGIVDYGADWLVFASLSLISFIVVFLTHGR